MTRRLQSFPLETRHKWPSAHHFIMKSAGESVRVSKMAHMQFGQQWNDSWNDVGYDSPLIFTLQDDVMIKTHVSIKSVLLLIHTHGICLRKALRYFYPKEIKFVKDALERLIWFYSLLCVLKYKAWWEMCSGFKNSRRLKERKNRKCITMETTWVSVIGEGMSADTCRLQLLSSVIH